jgi:OPA family glycerol-3-phosphate transporter-like MFS transporter/OPA family sugar phosphate sensor protein UhpC-like MFS transporter
VGLPEVAGTHSKAGEKTDADWKAVAWKYVFSNPWIWLLSLANFFVYVIRFSVTDWMPVLLTSKHIHLTHAGLMTAAFEVSGLIGALVGGWLTDRLFGGRCFRACVFYMALTGVSVFVFWKLADQTIWLNTLLLCVIGFFVYGPQCLIGIAAANLATKRAAATAVGLTGVFAYASTVLSGYGLGKLLEIRGWDAVFTGLIIMAAMGTAVCAIGWKAKAHGYETETEGVATSKSSGGSPCR